jgi:hypothetical protein
MYGSGSGNSWRDIQEERDKDAAERAASEYAPSCWRHNRSEVDVRLLPKGYVLDPGEKRWCKERIRDRYFDIRGDLDSFENVWYSQTSDMARIERARENLHEAKQKLQPKVEELEKMDIKQLRASADIIEQLKSLEDLREELEKERKKAFEKAERPDEEPSGHASIW